jgi:HK97 family phage portal protein
MGLLKLVQGDGAYRVTSSILGKGFANRLFGSRQMVNASSSIQPVIFGGPATYPDPNLLRFVQDGYSSNATVYTIISMAARKFGSIPRYVYKVDSNKGAQKAMRDYRQYLKQGNFSLKQIQALEKKAYDEDVVDNLLSELLATPNEAQGQDSFYELLCTFYMLCGEGFIWLNRGDIENLDDDVADALPPLEMFVIPPQYVELIPDPGDVWGVVGYYFNVNGQRVFLRKSDVIHWRKPNPNFDAITRTHLRGFSPLNAGNKLVTQDDSATDATVAMHQNDGARGVLTNVSLDNLDPVQKSQLENVIQRKVNNRDIKGAIATLQGDWKYLDFAQSSVDMELISGQEAVFVRICNLYGINPMMFLANATYQNIQQARKDLITGLVLPMCCSLRDEMNRVLLPAFGLSKDFTHDVDVTQLPELQNDMSDLVTSLMGAWWLTPNQRLAAMNEEEDSDPLMDERWIPNNLVLMDDAAMTDTLNSFTNVPGSNQEVPGSQGAGVPGTGRQKGNKEGLPAGAKG